MRTLEDQLSQYAAYHRDRRNVALHFVGIPLIVLAVATLLSRPALHVAGLALSPAVLVVLAICVYYLVLDVALGALMLVLLALAAWFGAWAAAQTTLAWLGIGAALFVVGWIIQFIGHGAEGRKPAFVDDIMGLAIGPLFIVVEALFLAGFRPTLRQRVDQRSGELRAGMGAAE